MFIHRFETPGLAHYSYAVGDDEEKTLAIIDPRRDVREYIEFAESHDARIAHVLETHIHADFASGARELADVCGAALHESGHDRGEDFEIAFNHSDIFDGESVEFGRVRLRALHTPGHTPEHVSYILFDLERSEDTPLAMFSGDFLFVGSVGRPDLLGEQRTMKLAQTMYRSIRERLADLPDGLEILPAHGAGSMCGSGMRGQASSTLGFERASNPYLDKDLDEDQFVKKLIDSAPIMPSYYPRMKKLNADGPRLGVCDEDVPALDADAFESQREETDAVVIDLRDQISFGGGHVPGSFGIGYSKLLAVWASWVAPYDRPILLVDDEAKQERMNDARDQLARVGLDQVIGFLEAGFKAWRDAGKPMEHLTQIDVRELHETLEADDDSADAPTVIDVRSDSEWEAGHIAQAKHVFGGTIEEHLDELPEKGAPIAVACGGGYRSTVISSVLKRHGYTNVMNITGGMGAWRAAGLPMDS